MQKKPSKKELTRARILEAASKSFKTHGYNGIGVDGIAKEANVTSGAFYAHMGSKEAAFKEILITNFEKTLTTIAAYQDEHGTDWAKEFVAYYLGKDHRLDLANGCWMTALTPELVNAPQALKELYEAQITEVIALIAKGFLPSDEGGEQNRAYAFLATLIGGLNMARAVQSEDQAEQITRMSSQAALSLIEPIL